MIVISDTNILSTMAAGTAFPSIHRLYGQRALVIPPAVERELQAGFATGKTYLQPVIEDISNGRIEVLPLSAEEEFLTFSIPFELGPGEREAIALAQIRRATLLSNDKEAARYCRRKGLVVVNLVNILRLLWTRQILSIDEVRDLIARASEVEKLTLTPGQSSVIFAPLNP